MEDKELKMQREENDEELSIELITVIRDVVLEYKKSGSITTAQLFDKLEKLYPEIEYVNYLVTHSWGQKVVRFYDLDGNLIEVGTPV